MAKPEKTTEAVYDARSLGTPKMLLLGVQHLFAMFGATVLVPALTGLDVATALFFAGIGTLLFHLITGRKVPAFLGSSFAFIGGYNAIRTMADGSTNDALLPYACFGVACAGLVYLAVALLFKIFGAKKVMRYFPPIVTGPVIICIGLTLSNSAVNNCANNWWIALVAILIVVIANIFGKGMIKIIPILLGVVGSYVFAMIVDPAARANLAQLVGEADWIGLPVVWNNTALSIFGKDFDGSLLVTSIITIMPISLATMMEHVGDICAISSTVGKNFVADPGLHRTLLGDGLATTVASLFGGPANTTYGENTGVLALSKVYDPKVVRLAAIFAAVLSFCPKFSAIIRAMPAATMGGVSLVLYGMISAVGVRNVVENHVDFTKSRNVLIAAMIMGLAIGVSNSAAGAISFNVGSVTISLSGLAVAALVGIVMNAVLPGKDYEFGVNEQGDTSVNFGTRAK
ncbi:MAG: uracil-xanthine permease family protein [Candidatus Faecousia sp.]|nr:uracil-xanthine permease family protein [Clostridiales bacterium]MDD7340871.1 uracil-xanthine permease family protein [Bacillota bacterium]MDY2810028.1 uracil-xanthine permease family protein [Candidatus Faecousia sp.]